MSSILRFPLKFLFSVLITLFITTAMLYATVMLTPAETRAELYVPKRLSPRMTEQAYQNMIDGIIERNHLNDPYPVQYYYWVSNLIQGNWGYSPSLHEDVLSAIIQRAPVTAELTLFSILFYIPLGIIVGVFSASRQNKLADHGFRLTAFIATSLPPFILAILLMAFFYVDLNWFQPGQTSSAIGYFIQSDQFRQYTGLLTVDSLLNGRPDICLDALRHLVMPAFTLAIAHWATLGRVTRATMIEEQQQDYVVAATARGISRRLVIWKHTLRNAIAPAFTSSLLSATSLLTGVFVVEVIFSFQGISSIAVRSMANIPDAPAAMGFAIYSVIVVLILMGILDLIQYSVDPRIRDRA